MNAAQRTYLSPSRGAVPTMARRLRRGARYFCTTNPPFRKMNRNGPNSSVLGMGNDAG